MIDPDFSPIIPPRYYDGYIAAPDRNTGGWTVYTYPNIVIWEFDNETEAEAYAKELNELDKMAADGYDECYE